MYRDVAKGTRLLPGCEMRDAGWERHRTHLASRIPCSYVLFLSLMLPFTVSSASRRPQEPHTRRHADGKVDGHVVVPHVHVTAIACLTRILTATVARVHGADRDPALVLHDLDLHLVGVALARALHGGHLDVPRAGAGADIAVHALDLDRLARGDFALPVELALGARRAGHQRQNGGGGEQREHGDAHGHSS